MCFKSKVSFCQAILKAFNNIFDYHERSRRTEFWYFNLFLLSIEILAAFILIIIKNKIITIIISIDFLIITIIVGLPLSVRRLHDIGKTGWLILIFLIPFGFIILIIWFATDSQKETNIYGPSEKYGNPSIKVDPSSYLIYKL